MLRRFLIGVSACAVIATASVSAQRQAVDLVNLSIGTGGEGQTFPAAGVPFGMTQWTPQTREGEESASPRTMRQIVESKASVAATF